jgi:hypothetical protein
MNEKKIQAMRREWLMAHLRASAKTRRQFANDIGFNVSMFSELCSGARKFTDLTLSRACKALGVPPPDGDLPIPHAPGIEEYERLKDRIVDQEYRLMKLTEEVRALSQNCRKAGDNTTTRPSVKGLVRG